MSIRRPGLSPTLMVILAVVVLLQSAVLFLLLMVPADRDPVLGPLRQSRVVADIVEMCVPAQP